MTPFGQRVRRLRHAKQWSLRDLAQRVGVGFAYLSRVENERLHFGDYPSTALIHRLADALEADEDQLLILAKRVPDWIRLRFLQRPEDFSRLASLDDKRLDPVLVQIGEDGVKRERVKRKAR